MSASVQIYTTKQAQTIGKMARVLTLEGSKMSMYQNGTTSVCVTLESASGSIKRSLWVNTEGMVTKDHQQFADGRSNTDYTTKAF